jgi:hypothetical protein
MSRWESACSSGNYIDRLPPLFHAPTRLPQTHSTLAMERLWKEISAAYFDTIPHSELLKSVARRVVDGAMLHLIKMWLEAPVEEMDEHGNNSDCSRTTLPKPTAVANVIRLPVATPAKSPRR